MRELSLFTGAGGGVLGTSLLGFTPVAYVERDPYCQQVLLARIEDGFLDPAPIFGDIRGFLAGGWADRYRGLVDVLTAGFPCQPHSVAGKQLGGDDPRDLWPETAETIRRVRPAFALLENVPGLLSSGYFEEKVLPELSEMGFDAEWGVLGADDVGAPHRRKRFWCLAYSRSNELWIQSRWLDGSRGQGASLAGVDGAQRDVADSERAGLEGHAGHESARDEPGRLNAHPGGSTCESGLFEDVADTDCWRLESERRCWLSDNERSAQREDADGRDDAPMVDSDSAGLEHGGESPTWAEIAGEGHGDRAATGGTGWWIFDPGDEGACAESELGVLADGVADRLGGAGAPLGDFVPRVAVGIQHRKQRLKALGNGQVPLCVATAWTVLYNRMMEGR